MKGELRARRFEDTVQMDITDVAVLDEIGGMGIIREMDLNDVGQYQIRRNTYLDGLVVLTGNFLGLSTVGASAIGSRLGAM